MSYLCGWPTPTGPCRNPTKRGQKCHLHAGPTGVDLRVAVRNVARPTADSTRTPRQRLEHAQRALELSRPPIQPAQLTAMMAILSEHDVRFCLIGGAAIWLHGVPTEPTKDADILIDREPNNLGRLAGALTAMNARIWVGPHEPEGLAVPWNATFLAQIERFLNLVTDHGGLDVNYEPSGLPHGYQDVIQGIVRIKLGELLVPTASLEDILRSKEAAGRPKDLPKVRDIRAWLKKTGIANPPNDFTERHQPGGKHE